MADAFMESKLDLILKDVVGEERHFSNIKALSSFIQDESTFWNTQRSSYPQDRYIAQICDHLQKVINTLNSAQANFATWDDTTKVNQIRNIATTAENYSRQYIAFSTTPFANKFLENCKVHPQQAETFWQGVITPLPSGVNIGTIAMLHGALQAYEFRYQDESAMARRREAEKRSIANLRRELTDKTDESIRVTTELMQDLQGHSQEFKNDLDIWRNAIKEDLATRLEQDQGDRDTFLADGHKGVQDLEKLYAEKLKLEKPAEYWKSLAQKHKVKGEKWAKALVAASGLTFAAFLSLFSLWLTSGRSYETLSSLHWQGVILLGAVLSLCIFVIKTFSRLTFSAFHLQQDAEEREQLAYFYLALVQDTAVDDESRRIVFQALFSRAESGLLSAEHGPTMPTVEIVKSLKSGQGN